MHDRRLIDYLPPVLQGFREYQAVMGTEDEEFKGLWGSIGRAGGDRFVLSASENGIMRWEKILAITPKATATANERKFTILARRAEQLPYTIRMLLRMLGELCGHDGFNVELGAGTYSLHVKIALTAVSNFDDVRLMLRRVCPANLVITLSIMFNTHSILSRFTHSQLAQYTHGQLRDEVFS